MEGPMKVPLERLKTYDRFEPEDPAPPAVAARSAAQPARVPDAKKPPRAQAPPALLQGEAAPLPPLDPLAAFYSQSFGVPPFPCQAMPMMPAGMPGMPAGMPMGVPPGVPLHPWPAVNPYFSGMLPGAPHPGFGLMPSPAMYPRIGGYPPGCNSAQVQASQTGDAVPTRSKRPRRGRKKNAQEKAEAAAAASTSKDVNSEGEEESGRDRSDVLSEVHNKCQLTLAEILPYALEFAKDKIGSKYLEGKMDSAAAAEKQELIEVLMPEAMDLANDQYGSTIVTKLFSLGGRDEKKQLVHGLVERLARPPGLANEAHGCRVVQHCIKEAPRDLQLLIATGLKAHVKDCIENMHGNHVIQKCIEQMPPESISFIVEAVEADPAQMAKHTYGCRVIQRLLEHCSPDQLASVLDKILQDVENLAKHRFGNYVVQHTLEHGRPDDKKAIIAVVRKNIIELSRSRCASNVVEKCFEIATVGEHAHALEEDRRLLMQTVLGQAGDSLPAPLSQMMDDKFGNYIVQRVIEHSRGAERDLLRRHISRAEPQLRNSANGKHILAAMEGVATGVS